MRYPNCIFDLYGTLVDIHTDESRPEFWKEMADWYRSFGADYQPEQLHRAYLQAVSQREQGTRILRKDAHEAHPEIQLEQVFLQLFLDKGVSADLALAIRTGERFREASIDYIRLYDGAVELLKTLRANGQKVYLLSNAQRIFTSCELRMLGIEPLFDAIYLSSDYGCKKPDRKFFELPLKEHGISPGSAIMVGNDGVCDIQGARELGLATVYIRSNISPQATFRVPGNWVWPPCTSAPISLPRSRCRRRTMYCNPWIWTGYGRSSPKTDTKKQSPGQ